MSPWRRLLSSRGGRRLAGTGVATATSAGLGTLATAPDSDWYAALGKPPWQPPPVAFPLVWTPLYADIAAVTAAALTELEAQGRSEEAARLRRALALNLILNTGWNVLFWRVRRPWLAATWCAVLAAQSTSLARCCGRVAPSLGWALAPYAAWSTFATALNVAIARRNG